MENYDFLQSALELFTLTNNGGTLQDILNAKEKIAEITNEAKQHLTYVKTESLRNSFFNDFNKRISNPKDRVLVSWYHFLVKSIGVGKIKNILVRSEMYTTIIICTIPIVHHFIVEYEKSIEEKKA